jgi:hypothetical protein
MPLLMQGNLNVLLLRGGIAVRLYQEKHDKLGIRYFKLDLDCVIIIIITTY